jgi:hypothetical protein
MRQSNMIKVLSRALMWLRSSDIITPKSPAKSPGARRRTQPEQARSLRVWQRVSLNSRAVALLLARRNGAQRPRSDRHHRSLLLFSGQVLDQLTISFLQLRVGLELLGHAGANPRATLDLVNVLQDKHPLQALAWQPLNVGPFFRISLNVGVDFGVDLDVVAVLRDVAGRVCGRRAIPIGALI